MTIINETTVVVFSSVELKSILENDNLYNYIFLGANINLSSGIAISNNKVEVTIDGSYKGVIYEYVDQKKSGTSDGIYITSSKTQRVTLKNINITGYNYYGIIYVPEQSEYKNTVVEYLYVNYTRTSNKLQSLWNY